jgi:pimeloyl-ACP methyl ester carboxylesterase
MGNSEFVTAHCGTAALWQMYDGIRCPTLLLRGEDSDLLSAHTADAMSRRGPKARVQVFPGVGHAPMLVKAEQRSVVRQFLRAP